MDKEITMGEDIPRIEGNVPKASKKRLTVTVTAAILIIISLIVHTAIICEAVEYIKNEGSGLLFSALLPYKIESKPTTPALPEGNTMEKEDGEDKQSPFIKIDRDLSSRAEGALSLMNETLYTPDLFQLSAQSPPAMKKSESDKLYGKESKKVLIYHTHATESYSDTYSENFRTTDPQKNMIAVGQVIKSTLEKEGIGVIHLTEQFDSDNWSLAYDKSNAAVRQVLAENPSIQYVFDIHRDSIGDSEAGFVRAVTEISGQDCAQLMFVCGTDEGGSGHTLWRDNLTSALHLQTAIAKNHQGLMRPVNLRRASFYQDSAPCALILECGTTANTLKEAKRSAEIFAKALAEYIKE